MRWIRSSLEIRHVTPFTRCGCAGEAPINMTGIAGYRDVSAGEWKMGKGVVIELGR
jgi:hypothetical protein